MNTETTSAEERWNAWVAKGLTDDARFKKHSLIAAGTLAILVAVVLFLLR